MEKNFIKNLGFLNGVKAVATPNTFSIMVLITNLLLQTMYISHLDLVTGNKLQHVRKLVNQSCNFYLYRLPHLWKSSTTKLVATLRNNQM